MSDLDPALDAAIDPLRDLPEWNALGVEAARRVEDETFGDATPPDDGVETTERTVPTERYDVPVRVYRPPELVSPAPALVFSHGGGFVLGTLDSADDLARRLALGTDRLVVSVDYRLAPEHPFPAGLDDVCAVIDWTFENAPGLEVDPGRVGVAGSSAGGNLAAAAAYRFRARDDVPELDRQVLFYPMLDPDLDRPSHHANADGPLLTRADLDWFWGLYRSGLDTGVVANPEFGPLAAAHLRGMPSAVVVTAGCDPLHDEGRAYAAMLARSGVPVSDLSYPGMCHGFLSLADAVPAAAEAWDDLTAAVAGLPDRNE
ncbi:alpha/beta hydrolase [Haloarchaeobius sp. TZWWS8]|uniref:alpha/beta hydrolase n=1 Tax=Haloarchaeobius sp. TZWWS8 TaxID=3446121 RepID=UPI003EB901ED